MRQEDKELLLKDICARLPYKVKVCLYKTETCVLMGIDGDEVYLDIDSDSFYVENIKPYLRPMSSMTEEEKMEFHKILVKSQDCSYENNESATTILNDWYLSKGFDVRGLISKGLALEAPEGMYKID